MHDAQPDRMQQQVKFVHDKAISHLMPFSELRIYTCWRRSSGMAERMATLPPCRSRTRQQPSSEIMPSEWSDGRTDTTTEGPTPPL
jgi:hypothetical protein